MKGMGWKMPRSSRILLILSFASYAASFAFPLMSTILVTRTGLSSSGVGWVMCAAFLLSAGLQPKIGALLDGGRDRLVLGLAAGGVLIGIWGIYASARAISVLVPALVVFITAFSASGTAASRIIEGTATDESRGKVALILMGTVNLGFAVSSMLAFFFLQTRQSQLLLLDAVTTLIYIAGLYHYRPRAQPGAPSEAAEHGARAVFLGSRGAAIGGTFLIFVSTAACLSAVPLLYARQGALGNQMSPVMFGLCNVVVAVAGMGFASALNEIPLPLQILASAMLFSIGHALLPWVDSQLKNVLVTVVWSMGEVFAYPITSRLIFAAYPAAEAGRAAGVKGSLMRLAMAATPALSALTAGLEPRVFSTVFGLIPLAGGALLFAAFLRQERPAAAQPLRSLQSWIQSQFQRSILLFVGIALGLIFSANSFLIVREKLNQLDDAGQSFLSSQLPNLQIYDFTRLNSDLEIFARNKPVGAARMLDATGIVIGRWSSAPDEDAFRDSPATNIRQSNDGSIDYVYGDGLGKLLIRLKARDNLGTVVGSVEIVVPVFRFMETTLLSAGALLLVMALTYVFGMRLARLSAKTASGPMEALSKALQSAEQPDDLAKLHVETEISEAEQLMERFRSLGRRLQEEESRRTEAEKREAIGAIASQVAHDVRSPLAALDSVMKDLSGLPEDKRSILRSAVGRIRDIANDLLEKNRETASASGGPASVQLVSSHADPLISEKRLQFRSRIGVEIDARLDASSYGLFARLEPSAFKRALSNLVNNAVEAIDDKGKVSVELSREREWVLVRVRDDGKGIPPDVLSRLGQRGQTHGKAGGSGLGLHHARASVESWGGKLELESREGEGTSVTIRLPRTPSPEWFVSQLELQPGAPIVVLDDDASIHQVWRGRFDSCGVGERPIETFHFSAAQELREWAGANAAAAAGAVYLVDYELLGSQETGLALIESLGLGGRAILVTSRFEERFILEECRRLGVRLIPKGMAGFVPIRARDGSKPLDAVLIDDDKLVQMVWKAAAKASGKTLAVFSSPKEFEAGSGRLDKRTVVYVDSNLADGLKGEEYARVLSGRGFARIILCTGHPAESFRGMSWISEVVGKDAPWPAA